MGLDDDGGTAPRLSAGPGRIVGAWGRRREGECPPSCPHLVQHWAQPRTNGPPVAGSGDVLRVLARRQGGGESVEPEEADVVAGAAVDREVREDLTDDRCELVAVARLPGEERDLRRVRQRPEQEVLV